MAPMEPEKQDYIVVDRDRLVALLEDINTEENLELLKARILEVKRSLLAPREDIHGLFVLPNGKGVRIRRSTVVTELDQALAAFTLERSRYYVRRLIKGLTEVRKGRFNDINLRRWKEYDDIITDSLWIIDRRDTSGAHLAWYWGNFVPQIPHQLLLRYTRQGEWVLDPFAGSGTTLIECRRLGRNGLGVELNAGVVDKARELVAKEPNPYRVVTDLEAGDSRVFDFKALLARHGIQSVQLLLMHPPYHDIIKFSSAANDLCNAPTTEAFLAMFGQVLDNTLSLLDPDRFLAVVIGDKYTGGEWVPLGFYCMQEVLQRGLLLKSIVVKNFNDTTAKRGQQDLWRYRALTGGFFVFKHEYILLFQCRRPRRHARTG